MNALTHNQDWYVPSAHPAIDKLASFKQLQRGWAFGEGLAFPQSVLYGAEQIIERLLLLGHSDIDIFPSRDGQIVVTAYGNRVTFDFSICGETKVPVTFSCEVDGNEIEICDRLIPPLSMESALLVLGGLLKWLSYESFIPSNTRAGNDALKVPHSNLQLMAPGYQSSNLTAPSLNRVQSARMLRLITEA